MNNLDKLLQSLERQPKPINESHPLSKEKQKQDNKKIYLRELEIFELSKKVTKTNLSLHIQRPSTNTGYVNIYLHNSNKFRGIGTNNVEFSYNKERRVEEFSLNGEVSSVFMLRLERLMEKQILDSLDTSEMEKAKKNAYLSTVYFFNHLGNGAKRISVNHFNKIIIEKLNTLNYELLNSDNFNGLYIYKAPITNIDYQKINNSLNVLTREIYNCIKLSQLNQKII